MFLHRLSCEMLHFLTLHLFNQKNGKVLIPAIAPTMDTLYYSPLNNSQVKFHDAHFICHTLSEKNQDTLYTYLVLPSKYLSNSLFPDSIPLTHDNNTTLNCPR